MSKNLLITGATGKQGSVVIDAVLELPNASDYTILAVTRNATSGKATALKKKSPNVKVIEGNLDDCPAIFAKAAAPIYGVFSVQVPFGGKASPQSEERQGKALADAAVANNVKHFVYTSVDRGGPNSDTDPTTVPHFVSKYNIEKHLEAKAAASSMTYTILRPVAFMENITPDMTGKLFVAAWKSTLSRTNKLQLVSTLDIGWFAAQAFAHPEDPRWKNNALSLAGDALTIDEVDATFKKVTGSPAPSTFQIMGKAILYMVGDLGAMFKWFEHGHGYAADIAALRKQNPAMLRLEQWLMRSESGFVKK